MVIIKILIRLLLVLGQTAAVYRTSVIFGVFNSIRTLISFGNKSWYQFSVKILVLSHHYGMCTQYWYQISVVFGVFKIIGTHIGVGNKRWYSFSVYVLG